MHAGSLLGLSCLLVQKASQLPLSSWLLFVAVSNCWVSLEFTVLKPQFCKNKTEKILLGNHESVRIRRVGRAVSYSTSSKVKTWPLAVCCGLSCEISTVALCT